MNLASSISAAFSVGSQPPPRRRPLEPPAIDLAPAIKRVFEQCASGKYNLKQIGAMARDCGLAYRKSRDPVPNSTVHKILRNRIYSGRFDFDGQTFDGVYEPIVSVELWDEVQAVLGGRGARRLHPIKKEFAFSRPDHVRPLRLRARGRDQEG